uniref:non-specific serine/threonine protein kinase n=1 Tax=Acanthochromis polyacanthus TaxID=80966 RepID=A0A3Q1GBX1_9TELE
HGSTADFCCCFCVVLCCRALGCLLYEMCCLTHAFQGPNFMSVLMRIVEGETPTLPSTYSADLNSVMQRMLQKQPSCRPTAAEILRSRFMEENMQVEHTNTQSFPPQNMTETKVHLQTLIDRSELEKMTPRERMRLRKLQAADEKAKRLRKLAEEKYEEIHTCRRELRSRHFEKVSLDVLNVRSYYVLFLVRTFRPHTASLFKPVTWCHFKTSNFLPQPIGGQRGRSLSELANQQPGSPECWQIAVDPEAG